MEKENVVDDVEKDVREDNSGAEKDTQTGNAEDEKTAVDTGKQQEDVETQWDSARALEALRKKNAENRALRERAKKAEKDAKTLSEYKQLYEQEQAKNLRISVGAEYGLPIDLACRLNGATKEELMEDAQKLLEFFTPKAKHTVRKPSPLDGKAAAGEETGITEKDLEKIMFG